MLPGAERSFTASGVTKQGGEQHHLVRGDGLVRVDQCDLEVVLAIALDGERTLNRQVDDGGRRLGVLTWPSISSPASATGIGGG